MLNSFNCTFADTCEIAFKAASTGPFPVLLAYQLLSIDECLYTRRWYDMVSGHDSNILEFDCLSPFPMPMMVVAIS